eukprot:5757928-Ditylum_brightwellii.AAC.1
MECYKAKAFLTCLFKVVECISVISCISVHLLGNLPLDTYTPFHKIVPSIEVNVETVLKVRSSIHQLDTKANCDVLFWNNAIAASMVLNQISCMWGIPTKVTGIISGYVLPGILLDAIQKSLEDIVQVFETTG